MKRRRLRFDSFDALIDEIDRLHACGYERTGAWDLPRACEHLTRVMRSSLEGFGDMPVPWIVRAFGRFVFKPTILLTGRMPGGFPTARAMVAEDDDIRPASAAVSHCIATIREVRDHAGAFHPSPLFGRLSPRQWRRMHLIHAAHHLSFLVPRDERRRTVSSLSHGTPGERAGGAGERGEVRATTVNR
ncbi:MAG: DUF1569 domain-containing protein [Tepidisphaeraceae bacterium]